MAPTTPVEIQICRHAIQRDRVVLTIDGNSIGLTKAGALHAAVLLLESSAEIEGRLSADELNVLLQLSRRLQALASGMN